MDDSIFTYTNEMTLNAPFLGDVLAVFRSDFSFYPPTDYAEFLTYANGGEGSVGRNSYLVLWKLEDLQSFNDGYQVNRFAPGIVLVGSDGGDVAYAFDTRPNPISFCRVPFIGMDLSEVEPLGMSFLEFLESLRNQ